MASFSDEALDEVKEKNEIVGVVSPYVHLRQKGKDYFGLCPFHKEKSASFSVVPEKQIFYCFGCGAGGNVISFIMRIENLDFGDAVRHLADRAKIELSDGRGEGYGKSAALRESLYDINAKAARFFYERLISDKGSAARRYISDRGISARMVKRFGLGYAPAGRDGLYKYLLSLGFPPITLEKSGLMLHSGGVSDKFRERLMFPILDAQNRVAGFGGRALSDGREPKYLNSPDTPVFNKSRNLFALNLARKSKSPDVLLVEGYMDALALHQAGFENVVASLGTAFNDDHCRTLKQYFRGRTVILLFDSDTAGESAALRAIPVLSRGVVPAKVLRLQGAKDPDEFIKAFGADAFRAAAERALEPTAFRLGILRKNHDTSSDGGKVKYLNAAAAIVAELSGPIERDVYINALARETGVSTDAVRGAAERRAKVLESRDLAPLAYVSKPFLKSGIPEGVMAASRNVLYWMASHPDFCSAIRGVLVPDEFTYPLYIKLAREILAARDAGRRLDAGALVSRFEDTGEQEAVTAVFVQAFPYENDEQVRSALNQHIRIIKNEYINGRILEEKDKNNYDMVQELGKTQRNMPISYI